jgi:hypothetical protein
MKGAFMILPNVRSSFGRNEAAFLIWLLTRGAEPARLREEQRLREQGLDALLDDPRSFNALMGSREFSSAPASLVFYMLIRHALLEDGLTDRSLADYLTALVLAFGERGRAWRPGGEETEFRYLVDIVAAAAEATDERAFLLRTHLGEFALWLSGLFPDHITGRVQRRGAPGIRYYEELGSTGYRLASTHHAAERHGVHALFRDCAASFPALRMALNRVADRHLFPARGDSIERLLRHAMDDFRTGGG